MAIAVDGNLVVKGALTNWSCYTYTTNTATLVTNLAGVKSTVYVCILSGTFSALAPISAGVKPLAAQNGSPPADFLVRTGTSLSWTSNTSSADQILVEYKEGCLILNSIDFSGEAALGILQDIISLSNQEVDVLMHSEGLLVNEVGDIIALASNDVGDYYAIGSETLGVTPVGPAVITSPVEFVEGTLYTTKARMIISPRQLSPIPSWASVDVNVLESVLLFEAGSYRFSLKNFDPSEPGQHNLVSRLIYADGDYYLLPYSPQITLTTGG